MTSYWTEPQARDATTYRPEQVERGRRLVSRDDLLKAERHRTRMDLGDLFLEVAPHTTPDFDGTRQLLARFASEIGISPESAREYRKVAAACSLPVRERVAATGVTVSYSVIREAAIDTAGSGRPPAERWEILLTMLGDAARTGERVTAQKYRQAIGARLTVDAGAGLTPARIIAQLDRDDVRAAVVAHVTDPAFLREALQEDPLTELRLRASLTDTPAHPADPPQRDDATGDERLLHQLRRHVHTLRHVVRMPPEQILNIADRDTLNELTAAVHHLSEWITKIENRKADAQ
ncbi:hypothetical protein [Streptomyces sp. NPDC089915]|uniref:hypothetical protein n=1 Tax=Streptomyces sp. NPDC089915 TaxID=3155186 RepID=UPI00341CF424